MRVRSLNLIHARIPLKRTIRHASHTRQSNDTLLVRCVLDDGTTGWGEGLPRSYVTGETIDSAWDLADIIDLSVIRSKIDEASIWSALKEISLGEATGPRGCFGNSLRSAIELAVLDACGRRLRVPMWKLIRRHADSTIDPAAQVQYVSVITSSKAWKVLLLGSAFRLHGFQQCKVKVGYPNDLQILQSARRGLGRKMIVRVDANEAWSVDEAIQNITRLEEFGIASVEQPISHAEVQHLSTVRRETNIPIMLDESLCSVSDANAAVSQNLCDLFNVRISKCGGIVGSLKLVELAREAGLGFQLGCLVGETAILSAAGRHLAVCLPDAVAFEGSYDRYLVRQPLAREDLTFGRGGWAPRLDSPGLGVTINERQVKRVTVREKSAF